MEWVGLPLKRVPAATVGEETGIVDIRLVMNGSQHTSCRHGLVLPLKMVPATDELKRLPLGIVTSRNQTCQKPVEFWWGYLKPVRF